MQEPYELLVIDVKDTHQCFVMEELGRRRTEMTNMVSDGKDRCRMEFFIPARWLTGFRSQFLTLTSGSGIMTHIFDHYGPVMASEIAHRINGVTVSMMAGKTLAYSPLSLQDRGRLCIDPGFDVYEGQIVGIHSRDNDLVVNPTKGKQLTNIRAAGRDDALLLPPPIRFSLEQALEFVDEEKLVEVTPHSVRLRKKLPKEHEATRAGRG
jgi:GTP-binding protein